MGILLPVRSSGRCQVSSFGSWWIEDFSEFSGTEQVQFPDGKALVLVLGQIVASKTLSPQNILKNN